MLTRRPGGSERHAEIAGPRRLVFRVLVVTAVRADGLTRISQIVQMRARCIVCHVAQ